MSWLLALKMKQGSQLEHNFVKTFVGHFEEAAAHYISQNLPRFSLH